MQPKKKLVFRQYSGEKTFPRTLCNINQLVGKLLLALPCNFSVVGNSNVSGCIFITLHPSRDLYQSFNFQTEQYVVFELAVVPAGVETQVF